MSAYNLPSTSGVYFFKKGNQILYIGKSVNIKARVASHLENAKINSKEALIVTNSDKVDYIVTDSEFKALLLESRLIQKYQPKYNIIWRDNKSYLYIKITVTEKYPKIFLVRREDDGKSLYFGPFSSTRAASEILGEVRRIIPFCTQKKISKHPCFYSKINLCSPCPNEIHKEKNFSEQKKLMRLYQKNIRQLISFLKGNAQGLIKTLNRQMSQASRSQKYEQALVLRKRIQRLEQLLYKKSFPDFDILTDHNRSREAVADLISLLHNYFSKLANLNRVECYDISNLLSKNATASMVVLTNGLIDRSQYRRFKIKNFKLRSDFEMLGEVLKRRFKNNWKEPGLIIVDGGKPQVRMTVKLLKKNKKYIPVLGIAKNPDRLVIGIEDLPTLRLKTNSPGFNLIRLIRDESHRFARKYHLFLRHRDFLL